MLYFICESLQGDSTVIGVVRDKELADKYVNCLNLKENEKFKKEYFPTLTRYFVRGILEEQDIIKKALEEIKNK